MIELGELDKQVKSFVERGVSVICVSAESAESASEVKRRFPSLTVISDTRGEFARGLDILLPDASPSGDDALAPTTILVDATGIVRWIYRPKNIVKRLTPEELLAKIDELL